MALKNASPCPLEEHIFNVHPSGFWGKNRNFTFDESLICLEDSISVDRFIDTTQVFHYMVSTFLEETKRHNFSADIIQKILESFKKCGKLLGLSDMHPSHWAVMLLEPFKKIQDIFESNPPQAVRLHTCTGDIFRYASRYSGPDRSFVELSENSYKKGWELAKMKVAVSDDSRIGLALNYSLFLFDTLKDTERAIRFGQRCMDEFIESRYTDHWNMESISLLDIYIGNCNNWAQLALSEYQYRQRELRAQQHQQQQHQLQHGNKHGQTTARESNYNYQPREVTANIAQ